MDFSPSRHDFFSKVRPLGRLSGLVLGGCLALPTPGSPGPVSEDLHRFSHEAMGSEVSVQAYASDPAVLQRAVAEGFAAVDALDARWSLYRPDSELARLNREASAGAAVAIAPDLWGLLQASIEVHRLSGGAFDITVGPLVRLWGFLGGPPSWPRPEELEVSRQSVGLRHVVLDPKARAVRFQRPGMELDLGAIAKGYVVDRMTARLHDAGVERFLVDFGGSSQYAAGAPPGQAGWYLYVRPTWDDRLPMKRVVARDLSLSTSSNDQRFWTHESQIYGHVLDPRTGRPTSHRGSVSVTAPSATQSDALATAFLVLGADEASRLIQDHPEWSAVFYSPEFGWREVGSIASAPAPERPGRSTGQGKE